MSVAEMKIEAINQITRLTEEESLKEILIHLSKLNKEKELNLSQHYNEIKDQYEDVLKNYLNDINRGCFNLA
jgi:hypothetical protein